MGSGSLERRTTTTTEISSPLHLRNEQLVLSIVEERFATSSYIDLTKQTQIFRTSSSH